jgi:ribosomal protein RSM22 (predicted rRNA methylase)
MNTLLLQVAVCLIPKIIDNISIIGSNSNGVSIHIMSNHLGCKFNTQKLLLYEGGWEHIALDNNFTIAGPIETVSAFVREQLLSKLPAGYSVDYFIQSVQRELFPTVNLNDCTEITGTAVEALKEHFPDLQNNFLWGCTKITDDANNLSASITTNTTGIKREHSAVSTTSDSRPSCSKKHCPDPVTL